MSLKERLLKGFNDKRTTDVVVRILPYAVTEGQSTDTVIREFHCHRLLLCQHRYWEKMLLSSQHHYREQQERLILLNWFDASWMDVKCFRVFFQCFYVDKEYFTALKADKYLRELHYLAVSINFVALIQYCESKIIETLTLQNVCDVMRYVAFVFPDYTQAKPNGLCPEMLPTPLSSSELYRAILHWINVFYPLEDSANRISATVKELAPNNCSLLKHLFQSKNTLFASHHERLRHLKLIIEETSVEKQQPLYDLYNHINPLFLHDDAIDTNHSAVYYMMDAYDNHRSSTPGKLAKDVKIRNLTFRYSYLPKEDSGCYDCISIAVTKKHCRALPPPSPLATIQKSRKLVKFRVKIVFINTKETSTIEHVAVIPIGSRFDIPDRKNQFLSNPFVLDKDQNKLAAAHIELKFIGYTKE